MNLCVFTCDYAHPPTDCSFLEASCTRVGVALHKFGQGSTWPSYTDRLRDGAVFLQNRPEEFVLFVDSADTYLLDGSEEILRKFREFNAPFVFSAETNCWPDSSLADHFPWNGTKYRFLNAGAWMGSRSWIIDRWLRIWERYHSQFPQDDTRCLVQAWIDGMIDGARIDHQCGIFMSYFGYVSGDMDEESYRINRITGSMPSVAHFNGRSEGRELTYTKAIRHGL